MAEGKSIGREENSNASASSLSHGMGAEGRGRSSDEKGDRSDMARIRIMYVAKLDGLSVGVAEDETEQWLQVLGGGAAIGAAVSIAERGSGWQVTVTAPRFNCERLMGLPLGDLQLGGAFPTKAGGVEPFGEMANWRSHEQHQPGEEDERSMGASKSARGEELLRERDVGSRQEEKRRRIRRKDTVRDANGYAGKEQAKRIHDVKAGCVEKLSRVVDDKAGCEDEEFQVGIARSETDTVAAQGSGEDRKREGAGQGAKRRKIRGKQSADWRQRSWDEAKDAECCEKPHSHLAKRRRLHGKQRGAAPTAISPGMAGPCEVKRAENRPKADSVQAKEARAHDRECGGLKRRRRRRKSQQPFVREPA